MRHAKLLPCPFCGSAAWIVEHPRKGAPYSAEVRCTHHACGCGTRKHVDYRGVEQVASAVAAWNRRPETAALAAKETENGS